MVVSNPAKIAHIVAECPKCSSFELPAAAFQYVFKKSSAAPTGGYVMSYPANRVANNQLPVSAYPHGSVPGCAQAAPVAVWTLPIQIFSSSLSAGGVAAPKASS